jgi:hypothetical protein
MRHSVKFSLYALWVLVMVSFLLGITCNIGLGLKIMEYGVVAMFSISIMLLFSFIVYLIIKFGFIPSSIFMIGAICLPLHIHGVSEMHCGRRTKRSNKRREQEKNTR